MALVEDAQADTVQKFGPLKPYIIEICPAERSEIILGIKYGLNLGVPSPFANSATSCSKVVIPPIPAPQITPIRSRSSVAVSMPESSMASLAQMMANCANKSYFRASFLSKYALISRFLTSQANLVLYFDVSKRVIGPAPLTPLINEDHVSGTLLPRG